jgi:hypothetical protein
VGTKNRLYLQRILVVLTRIPCVKAPSLLGQNPHMFVSKPPPERA